MKHATPREFWGDITGTLDKGKTLVIEASHEKPECWDEDPGDFHVIEYSAFKDLRDKYNHEHAQAEGIKRLYLAEVQKREALTRKVEELEAMLSATEREE